MIITCYTRYDEMGASSRYRFINYKKFLKNYNIKIDIYPFFNKKYLIKKYKNKTNFIQILFFFIKRFYQLIKNKNNIYFIEKELFPYMPLFIEMLFLRKKKFILDFDDAIYLNYHKNFFIKLIFNYKIEKLSKKASHIFVGSNHLYDYFKKFNSNISILPTVIDFEKYSNVKVKKFNKISIVWIGTPSTKKYLSSIIPSLIELKKEFDLNLIVIGAKFKNKNIKNYKWSENTEVRILKKCHIGIMPLDNSIWSKSKCSFKIIQYLASGLAAVASDIGQNSYILNNDNGLLISKKELWYDKLKKLVLDVDYRSRLSLNGIKIIENKYNYNINTKNLIRILKIL